MEKAMEPPSLLGMLETTSSLNRDMEALRNEHKSLLTHYQEAVDHGDLVDGGWDPELEEAVKKEKEELVNASMKKLEEGLSESQLMLLLANYVSALEADKAKLRAQVKRLCSENNWLRDELTQAQTLLGETEIALAKTREEKEGSEFLLNLERCERGGRERSPAMVIDVHEEEQGGLREGVEGSSSDGQEAVDYEVPEKIKTLHHLALQYVNQGKPDVAVPLCKKAVKELEAKRGRDNPDLAAMLNVLAVIYRDQGKLQEATKVLQETLEIRERVFGTDHAAVASTLNNLSVLHGKCGDFKIAEPYCRKALEIRQKLLGSNHPDVAKQFTNLAILCSHLGKYDEVEYYYQRALEIFQTELGPDDPNVTKTMSNLANCYLKQGKYSAAENIFKKVLHTVQVEESGQSSVSEEASQLVQSSSPRSPNGRSKEEPYFDKGGWHRANLPQSPTVSSTLKNLSVVYREQGKLDTANELDKLTTGDGLDRSQQDRMNELLADTADSPLQSTQSTQVPRQKSRGSLSLNVRRLFGLRGSEQSGHDT